MAKRRASGEGNIRKRSDGRWEGRYTAGHNPVTGKPIYKNVLGKSQSEVLEKLETAIKDSKKLDFTNYGQYTVGQWMDVWYEYYAVIKVRPSSHQTYRGYIEHHIKPYIGEIPLEKLTTLDLQKLYSKLLTGGRVVRKESKKQPKGLSAKTVRNINQIISSAMDQAVRQKLIISNPTDGCALPRIEHKEMHTLSDDRLSDFLKEAKASGVYEMYYIELATGLRRGELLGLKWDDVDWKRKTIRICRQVARINGEVVEAPLKTKNAYRTISLGDGAIAILEAQKEKTNDKYIFPSPNGGPISPDSVQNMLNRVLKRAGLPKIRVHDLRHTFATLALQNGVDIKTVSGMLGHYSAGFTLDTYTHVTTPAQIEAANTMGRVLGEA